MVTQADPKAQALKEKWCKRVSREIKAHKAWRDQAKRSEQAYRDDDDPDVQGDGSTVKKNLFPIWWSTVQITHAAIYAKSPKPDVRKRYSSNGKSDDNIAQAIERALGFTIDTTSFDANGHLVVDDYLVGACGVAKVELETQVGEAPVIDPMTQQPIIGDDGKPLMQKIIKRQSVKLRHFHWSMFGWEPGKDWESCDWIRFRHELTPEEIEDRWGVELDMASEGEPKGTLTPKANQYKATLNVDEIWDRKTRRQLFVCEEHNEPLEVVDDPLRLEAFYPCPKPIFTNLRTDRLVPKPDYMFIQTQCASINRLTQRIELLTKQIKDVGFYDASLSELASLATANDGDRIPVKNLMERLNKSTKGDFDQVMAVQDNSTRVIVLRELMQQREAEKAVVFETLGISDIIRGATEASETAEAQKLKSQWGNVRIGPKMRDIAGFFRDVFRLFAEIIAEHFEPDQINRMAGMELTPEEIGTMKDDLSRSYAIDVETDSTIAADDAAERAQRLEMVKAMTDYLGVYLPLAQQNLIPAEMVKQTLLFVLASFKYGRQLEDSITQMPDSVAQLQKLAGELQQCQQQLQQSQEQGQQMQAELAKADQAKQARDDALAQADVQLKTAQANKVMVEANTPPDMPMPEGVDPLAVEEVKIKWFDAETRRMALEQKQAEPEPEPDTGQAELSGSMSQIAQGLSSVAEAVIGAQAPKSKRARMTRQPDGSYDIQSDEG